MFHLQDEVALATDVVLLICVESAHDRYQHRFQAYLPGLCAKQTAPAENVALARPDRPQ